MYGTKIVGLGEGSRGAAPGNGRFFSLGQRAIMKGSHSRQNRPILGKLYVAGVALPRPEALGSRLVLGVTPVTVTVGELEPWSPENGLRVVGHYRWPQPPDGALIARLRDVLWGTWGCEKVLVDGLAAGDRVLSLVDPELPDVSVQLVGEAVGRPALGAALLQAVDAEMVQVYADDDSPEHREFWAQAVRAQVRPSANGGPDFHIEPSTGDDGFLTSLALALEAGRIALDRIAHLAEPVAV